MPSVVPPIAAAVSRVALSEDAVRQTSLRVDREAGVIYGVKVCGLTSRNGRTYPAATLKEAVALYDGVPANLNHTKSGRPVQDRIGQFARPVAKPDGVYADLHYNRSHPLAGWLAEQADRFPRTLGFSHVADGDQDTRSGKVVKIHEVKSVDLVDTPATNRGMFEGAGMELNETNNTPAPAKTPTPAVLTETVSKADYDAAIRERDEARAELVVRILCESLNVRPTQVQTRALMRETDEAARKELAESFLPKNIEHKAAPTVGSLKPRSAPVRVITEELGSGSTADIPREPEKLAARWRD